MNWPPREPSFWQHRLAGASAARALARAVAVPWRWVTAAAMPADGPTPGGPVIAVGSPLAGGAGKTPVCLALVQRARALGVPAVYAGRAPGSGARHRYADEVLLARLEGEQTIAYGEIANWAAAHPAGVVVADDGWPRHGERARARVIVLPAGPAPGLRPLPWGPARYPLPVLTARDMVVWHHDGAAWEAGDMRVPAAGAMREIAAAAVAHLVSGAADFVCVREGRFGAAEAPARALAFAGIARPGRFFAALAGKTGVAGARVFGDHHIFTAQELVALRGEARRLGAVLVTTAKDLARLCGQRGEAGVSDILALRTAPRFVAGLGVVDGVVRGEP